MNALGALTLVSFRQMLQKRLTVVVILVMLIVTGISSARIMYSDMAAEAGEAALAAQLKVGALTILFKSWFFFSSAFVFFLAVTAVASEIRGRTLIAALSRPVDRWKFLAGIWLGAMSLSLIFHALGLGIGLAVSQWLGFHLSKMFWFGVAQAMAKSALFTAVAVGLSAFLPPTVAGVGTILLMNLPTFFSSIHPALSFLKTLAVYLSPADVPADLISAGLSRELLNPDYFLYVRIFIENLGYGACVFVLGALIFSRRDVAVK